ncbi:hypothetical protein [Spirosoma pomorum]
MEFITALIDLYQAALANLDFVYNLASFWGTVVGCLVFKRNADWGDRASWLLAGYFFSRYIGPPTAQYTFPNLQEAIRFVLAMFFSFILALIVKIFEYVGGNPKFIPAIVMALLPSFIANKLQPKDEESISS